MTRSGGDRVRYTSLIDRRRALKTIGAAGAAAAGSSLIASSPAFAYDQPTNPTGGAITANTIGNQRVNVNSASFGTAMCPASATSTSVNGSFVRWDISIASITPGNSTVQLRPDGGGGVITTLPASYSGQGGSGFRLRKRNGSGGSDRTWNNGDSFSVDLVVQFTCTYSDSTTRTLDHTFSFTITKGAGAPSANNWVVT